MTETIKVSESLELHAVAENHVTPLYQLICKNKTWLMLHQRGYAKMFMIFKEDELIGVISFNRIEPLNKTAEIGYWLDESHQGQGIISQALQALIHHYAQSGELRRFVIKCRVDNVQSNQVALRNGFILEGCLKQAEFLNDAYDDVNLYARIIDSQ